MPSMMTARFRLLTAVRLAAALAGCKTSGDIVVDEGVGITAVRSRCPAVGIPDYTGDITLFRTPGDRHGRQYRCRRGDDQRAQPVQRWQGRDKVYSPTSASTCWRAAPTRAARAP
jgi:hypothetical protein